MGRLFTQHDHPDCNKNVWVAYLQFAKPELPDMIKESVLNGAKNNHPYFISVECM